jgi:hypothetical protein
MMTHHDVSTFHMDEVYSQHTCSHSSDIRSIRFKHTRIIRFFGLLKKYLKILENTLSSLSLFIVSEVGVKLCQMFSIIFETNCKVDKDQTLKLVCCFIQGMPMLKLVKKGLGTT